MPCSAIASRNPRLVITVTTTVSPGEHAPVVPVDGAHGDDLVAVDQLALLVDGEHAVGVTVEGQPGVGAAVRTPSWRSSGWVDPQPALMFVPSGGAQHLDVGTETPQRGATAKAAPLAQSTTSDSPSRRAVDRTAR